MSGRGRDLEDYKPEDATAICPDHDVADDEEHQYHEHMSRGRLTASSDLEDDE